MLLRVYVCDGRCLCWYMMYFLLCFVMLCFMNFMFPKHCRINLLELKCETTLVITLDIHFLGKAFLLITGSDLSHEPVIMSFNVSMNLSLNFAEI